MHRSISFICICGHCVWAFGELSCPLFTSSAAQKEVHNSNRGNAIPSLLYHRKMNLLTIRLQLLLVGGLCLSLGGPLNINYSSIYGLPNASMSPCPRHFVIEFVCPPKWQLHVIRIGHECDDRCKSSGVLVLERWMSGQAQELNLRMCMDGDGMRRPVASTVDMGGGRIYCSCRKLSKCRMVCLYGFWMCHEDVLYRCPIVPTWILTLSSSCMSGWQQ